MKLEIIEHCFGPDVRIDGESLFKHEHDNRSDEEVSNLQDRLLQELSEIKANLDMSDWSSIANIIAHRNHGKFEYDDSNSDKSDCDQCGNYNYRETYNKK